VLRHSADHDDIRIGAGIYEVRRKRQYGFQSRTSYVED
jgi:hypothetical protein